MDVILIILAIIGGLAGFLKDKSDTNSNKQKRTASSPRPSPAPFGGAGETVSNNQPQSTVAKTSIEEQQQEQRERLADRMNTDTQKALDERKHDAIITDNSENREPDRELSAEQKRFKRRIKNNLNQKGLVNGVIMAEVLGSPRATKPYQSVVKQRRK
ncbi:hypothetical protein SAMN05216232_1790 [Virgibacillus subterraneus]|uniref:Uncharacterized protein n=2 Tax=Virgibacillus TaxID=84406 RepID=A0A1H1BAK8_9BACI|nr:MULTISPECIES: hypothetical protein [Virgibacillus]SDQ48851.1 hypothetical protein SAMN05216231_1672 [Virgibacillus salinus]SEQ17705.1 hypothetical protein SAMN05216232_1790 [Virgibacillus subterraneus]